MDITNFSQYVGRDLEAMAFAENYHKWIIDEIKPYLGQYVAEVGAGTGNFSHLLIDHIETLHAFEPSKNMYLQLKKRFEHTKNVTPFNNCFKLNPMHTAYDAVLYINVLEHIEKDLDELSYTYHALVNNGHALIFAPALPFLYSKLDKNLGHYRRYKKVSLIALAQQAGFKIIKAKYFDIAGIIPWYISFVLMQRTITGANVSLYDKVVIPFMRQIEQKICPPIGKNILLIGKKQK